MKAGRNEPCPCGNGKKYKKCCLFKEYREALDPVEDYKAALSNVIETATHFAGLHFRTEMEKAIEDFVGPDDPGDLDDVAMMSFADYFLIDHRLSDGGTIFDHFVDRRGAKLSALEQKMLSPLQQAHISLYEVQSVDPGRGFRVKEVFVEQEHWIAERRPTESLVIWTLIATRIIRVDDVSLMVRSGIPFQPMEKPLILNALSKASRGRFPKRPAARKKFFRNHGEFFFLYHLQRKRQLARPVLMTMENERMVLVDIHYLVLDWEKTVEALEGIEEFTLAESVDNELVFDWVVPHEKGPLQNILRGTITLTPTRMIARCRSKERAEKVKKIIDERLKGFVKHQMDKIQDIYQALEEYKPTFNS
jgi:hypothetical protein